MDAGVLASGFQRASTLEFTLAAPAFITAYELFTANDMPGRDPASWSLWAKASHRGTNRSQQLNAHSGVVRSNGLEQGGSMELSANPNHSSTVASQTPGASIPTLEEQLDATGWWLLDAQRPYSGRRPARLSSFGRLSTTASLADASPNFPGPSLPWCGSAEHLAATAKRPQRARSQPKAGLLNITHPLLIVHDEFGAPTAFHLSAVRSSGRPLSRTCIRNLNPTRTFTP